MKKDTDENRVNSVPSGFLKQYRAGESEGAVYIPLTAGFLRLEYGACGEQILLSRVSFVSDRSLFTPAIGNVLEFSLKPDCKGEVVTLIGEMSVSGLQWVDGTVQWGHTYGDDLSAAEGRKIDLDSWVDECIDGMINPPAKIIKSIMTRYEIAADFRSLKNGDRDARERLWERCSPATQDEADMVLELIDLAISDDDDDLLFSCCDPLKRATGGIEHILEAVTSTLERGLPESDYDRSELQEILAAHAESAARDIPLRWMELCRRSVDKNGAEALHAINEGALFKALASVPAVDDNLLGFMKSIISLVEASPAAAQDGLEVLHSLRLMRKRVSGV